MSIASARAGKLQRALKTAVEPKEKKNSVDFMVQLNEVTTIYLSDNNGASRQYTIHKSLVCHHSRMLGRAFNSPFIEGQTQSIKIEDCDNPDAFGAIQAWMYNQPLSGWKEQLGAKYIKTLYHAWVLADRLIIPELQNDLMPFIMQEVVPLNLTDWIYANTAPKSKMRKWCADGAAVMKDKAFFQAYKDGGEIIGLELLTDICEVLENSPRIKMADLKLEKYLIDANR